MARGGAIYLRDALNIHNLQILNAVRYHTTGRANMTRLEQIVYLADLTSKDRTYGGVEKMRDLADTSLDDAMREAMEFIMGGFAEKGADQLRYAGRLQLLCCALNKGGAAFGRWVQQVSVASHPCTVGGDGVFSALAWGRGSNGSDSPGEREMEFEPLSAKAVTVLGCGINETGTLTDVIDLGRFDLETDRISLLQTPRDTYIGGRYVTGKINAVYGHPKGDSGIQELKTLVEKQLQLPIDYTATITLSGLRSMVDAMGGVEVEVPFQMEYLPGMVLEEGKQRLNGEQAEWFIRYRKGYATGDIGRLGAQKEFLHGVLDAVRREGRLKSIEILLDHAGEVKTDLPLGQMASLANRAYQVPDSGVEFYLLPGRGTYHNGYSVYEADRGSPGGSFE